MLISFIIPVFNRESLLPEAMQSILNSSMKDYEIILVDDGSVDQSRAICAEYEKKYPFVHVIYQPQNMGAGAARNAGIKIAQGEWLFFLDSDDLIYTDHLPMLAQKLEELPQSVGMVAIDYVDEYRGTKWEYHYLEQEECLSTQEFLQKYPSRLCVAAWCSFFRNIFLRENDIRFLSGTWREDYTFNLDVLCCKPDIVTIPMYFYCYRMVISSNSAANGRFNNHEKEEILFLKRLCKELLQCQQEEDDIRASVFRYNIERLACSIIINFLKEGMMDFKLTTIEMPKFSENKIDELGLKVYCQQIFCAVLSKFQEKECFLAPAGISSRLIADYLTVNGCRVLGFFDNNAISAKTPRGLELPIYPREKAIDIVGEKPIIITSASLLGDKLKKYYQDHNLNAMVCTTQDFEQ